MSTNKSIFQTFSILFVVMIMLSSAIIAQAASVPAIKAISLSTDLSSGAAGDNYGTNIARDGNLLVVGAPFADVGVNTNQGTAYVYDCSTLPCAQKAQLFASNGNADDYFGTAVAVVNGLVVVGAQAKEGTYPTQGAAYVFDCSAVSCTEQDILVSSAPAENSRFAGVIAIDGTTVLIGAPLENFDGGNAYVFDCSTSNNCQLQKALTAPDGWTNRWFGSSVAIDGTLIVVGAYTEDIAGRQDQGSAYVFSCNSTFSDCSSYAKLVAADGVALGNFGIRTAVSGTTVAIGARGDDIGGNDSQGSVYVYDCSVLPCSAPNKVTAPDGAALDRFGVGLLMKGSTLVIGATGDDIGSNADQGSAYVFQCAGTTCAQIDKVVAPDGAASDTFGVSVAIEGGDLIVGAPYHDVGGNADQGSIYFFDVSHRSSSGAAGDNYGMNIARDGNLLVVGAPFADVGVNTNQGTAYVYDCSTLPCAQKAQLFASNGNADDYFGTAVAVVNGLVVVGAQAKEGTYPTQGAAYVFDCSAVSCTEQDILVSSAPAENSRFAGVIAIDGTTVLIGAPLENFDGGNAYVFDCSTSNNCQLQKALTAPDGWTNRWFGSSVAIDGTLIVVGAYTEDIAGRQDQGSAYVFSCNSTFSDCSSYAKLVAADGVALGNFGIRTAVSGTTVAIGARGDDIGGNDSQGSVYVYDCSVLPCSAPNKVTAPDGAALDRFGVGLLMKGSTLVIGATGDDIGSNADQGSAYVFQCAGTTCAQIDKVVAPDGAASDTFGVSVAIEGGDLIVGAPYHDVGGNADQGSIYFFDVSHRSSSGAAGDNYGTNIARDGNLLVVGAPFADVGVNTNQGTAYVYDCSTLPCVQKAQLFASNGNADDYFGTAVAVVNGLVVVGAQAKEGTYPTQGAAYVFDCSAVSCTEQDILVSSAPAENSRFGGVIAIDGTTVLIGAPLENFDGGNAYVFDCSTSNNCQLQKALTAPDGWTNRWFGSSVAIDGTLIVVGAYTEDIAGRQDQGSAYVFSCNSTFSDCSSYAKLVAADGVALGNFGIRTAVSGTTVAIGARGDDIGGNDSQGSVYVYDCSVLPCSAPNKVTAPDGAALDRFGVGLLMKGSTLVIGATGDDIGSNADQGSAYVFQCAGTTCAQIGKVMAPDGAASDTFGVSVAIEGGDLIVGAPYHDVDGNANQGSIYFFVVSGVNDLPTISDIPDGSTSEGTATGDIAFTIGDVETPADSITVVAESSNTTLVPNENITLDGSGADRTINITPAFGQNGTTTITVTVDDGTDTASDTFLLTVNAGNNPPTISDIPDGSTSEGTATGDIAFTIGDVETPADSITVVAESSNTTLVPNENITLDGSGADRTINITPAFGQNGTTTITVTVDDGTDTASDTFLLTVNAGNNPPTISDIPDGSTSEGTATGDIAFTIGDVETPADSITVVAESSNTTLVPNENITLGGSGADRTINITPAFGQNGTTTITVTVDDGTDTASDTFLLTVNDTPYTLTTFSSTAANDGWTLESSEYSTRANARNNSGYLLVGDDAKNKQYRSLLYFDTISLPDNAVISTVKVKIKQEGVTGANPFTTHGALLADMAKGFFGKSALENTDFQARGAPRFNVGSFTPVGGDWYQLVLSPANFKFVNLNGVTQFRIRFAKDDNNDKDADIVSFYSGDDVTNPPQLIVEYTTP